MNKQEGSVEKTENFYFSSSLEVVAYKKIAPIWHNRNYFHIFNRFANDGEANVIDRLPSILEVGVVSSNKAKKEKIHEYKRNFEIEMRGLYQQNYQDLVFLHNYSAFLGNFSGLNPYFLSGESHNSRLVIVISGIKVKTPEQMGRNWVRLSPHEVYVKDQIEPRHFRGLVICGSPKSEHSRHNQVEELVKIMSEVYKDLPHLMIPLYGIGGSVYWPGEVSQ